MFFLLIICLLFVQFPMFENTHLLYLSESLKFVLHRFSDGSFILVENYSICSNKEYTPIGF